MTEGSFGFEIFDSGIFLVSISCTWGFFAYSKQFEVVILMSLMKQKKFLSVSSVSFLGGRELGDKKGVATFKITLLAFAQVRQQT